VRAVACLLILLLPAIALAGPDELFEQARTCEDEKLDPACALALYEQILREFPEARVAAAAKRRAESLRAQVGQGNEFAPQAAAYARLVDQADGSPPDDVIRRADALAATAGWSGAPEVALWVAEWLRRHGKLGEASTRFEQVARRWPGTKHEPIALRGAASTALEAHAWSRAEAMAHRLSASDPADRIVRDDLLAQAAQGRSRGHWYLIAWIVAIAGTLGLAGSLIQARGRPWPPPIEVIYLAPISVILTGVALTANRLIAPAVITIIAGGLVVTWLSGAALEAARAHDRPLRARALAQVAACLLIVASLGYIAITRDNLLDTLIETVRFGPEN